MKAGRLKDYEQTIHNLQQQTQSLKLRDADAAHERLDEEVKKANKMVMGNRNSSELSCAEVRFL